MYQVQPRCSTDEGSDLWPGEGQPKPPTPWGCLSQGPQPRMLLDHTFQPQRAPEQSMKLIWLLWTPGKHQFRFSFTEGVLIRFCPSSIALGNVGFVLFKLLCEVLFWFCFLLLVKEVPVQPSAQNNVIWVRVWDWETRMTPLNRVPDTGKP